MGLQRSFTRRQFFAAGEKPPKVLDAFNETLPTGHFLHATKGYRYRTEKGMKANRIVAEQKMGKFPPAIIAWRAIKQLLGMKGSA